MTFLTSTRGFLLRISLLLLAQSRSRERPFCLISCNIPEYVLVLIIFFFQLPELRAQHDVAIMAAYASKDLEIEELKTEAQQQWEELRYEGLPRFRFDD